VDCQADLLYAAPFSTSFDPSQIPYALNHQVIARATMSSIEPNKRPATFRNVLPAKVTHLPVYKLVHPVYSAYLTQLRAHAAAFQAWAQTNEPRFRVVWYRDKLMLEFLLGNSEYDYYLFYTFMHEVSRRLPRGVHTFLGIRQYKAEKIGLTSYAFFQLGDEKPKKQELRK
jgi:hypothetical protein